MSRILLLGGGSSRLRSALTLATTTPGELQTLLRGYPRLTPCFERRCSIEENEAFTFMAAMAATGSSGDPSTALNRAVDMRNPLPLSASQESQVRDLYYKRVRGYCANEIRGKRSLLARWACPVSPEHTLIA